MPSLAPTLGVPKVQLSTVDSTTTVGSLAAATIAYSVLAPTKFRHASSKIPLNGTYKVTIALVGYDIVNRGFTIAISSPQSVGQVVPLGSGILIRIAQPFATSAAGANMENAIAVAIFLSKGSGNPRLANFGYIDPDNDFSYLAMYEPLLAAPNDTQATLGAATVTDTFGSRDPKAVVYSNPFRTVGGVRKTHRQEAVRVDQDDAPAYDSPVARAVDLEFSVLSNSLLDLAQLSGGDYQTYLDTNGDTVELADTEIQAITSQLTGNKAIKVLYAPDKLGHQATELFMGNVDVSNAEFVENYQKTEQFRLDQKLVGAPIDGLTGAVGSGISYNRYV